HIPLDVVPLQAHPNGGPVEPAQLRILFRAADDGPDVRDLDHEEDRRLVHRDGSVGDLPGSALDPGGRAVQERARGEIQLVEGPAAETDVQQTVQDQVRGDDPYRSQDAVVESMGHPLSPSAPAAGGLTPVT